MRHLLGLGLALAAIASACNGLVPSPPAATINQVGSLAGVRETSEGVEYTLTDGTIWTGRTGQYRVAYDMSGAETLFVRGTDRDGTFVMLIGDQDGLPGSCRFALRYGAVDAGTEVRAQGVLWPKSGGFSTDAVPSAVGEYPSNSVVCLDEAGSATGVILATPSGSGGAASAAP
jgi:hypothetical protein